MDYDDVADLLGNKEMPIRRQQEQSLLTSLCYAALCAIAFVILWFAYHNGQDWLRTWQENNYRLMIRRKYGIPDSNKEPFNVAYAKAVQRRKQEEQRRSQERASFQAPGRAAAREGVTSGRQEAAGPSFPRHRIVAPSFSFVAEGNSSILRTRLSVPPQNSGFRASRNEVSPQAPSQLRTANQTRPDTTVPANMASTSQRKRALDRDDDGDETSKKSRGEPVEIIDVDAQDTRMDVAEDEVAIAYPQRPKRGSKRQAEPVEETGNVGSIGKKAGKRARRQSKKLQEVFDIDEERDQLMELDPISRGKKRDRTEAGSTFGGDDDSSPGRRGRKNRRQKRKSLEVDAAVQARGTKRSFDIESTLGSDEENDVDLARSKSPRKRGKRMGTDADDSTDKSFVEPVTTAQDTVCGGRKIGEEWQANGQLYKVGPDGRRLRQVLVRKRRSRFNMPEDSQHPDTQAKLVVLVEMWLKDDEFKAAEERGDVYYPGADDSGKVEDYISPAKAGKQLLWSTPQKAMTVPRKAFRSSIVTNVVNPFERPSFGGYSKRVSIAAENLKASTTGSPMLGTSKSYSKWEKQDLEAEAMAKLRKKLEEEKKVASPDPKKVSFQLPSLETGSSGKAAPSIVSSFSASDRQSDSPAVKPPASSPFALPASTTSSGDVARAPTSSVTPTTTTTADQPKPSISITPSQPSKDQWSVSGAQPGFGNPPFGTQPSATLGDGKAPSAFGSRPDGQSAGSPAFPSVPKFFGDKGKSSDGNIAGTSPLSSNMFTPKPAAGFTPTATVPAATGGISNFLGTKDAAQSGNLQATSSATPTPALGTPSGSAFPSFGAPAKETASGKPGEASTAGGSGLLSRMGGFAAGSTGISAPASSPFSSQTANASSKSADQTVAPAAPKFNFGFSAKPAATTVPSSIPSTATAEPAKSTTTAPTFKFNLIPPTQPSPAQAPGADATSAAHKSSFGSPTTQPTSSVTLPQSDASGSASGGLQFGGSRNGVPSAFGGSAKPAATTASTTPSPFGGGSSIPSPFGSTAKPATASAPFGGASTASSPFGSVEKSSAPLPSSFGGPRSLGAAANPNTSASSPFDLAAKPAPQPTAENQGKPIFSFNFGAAPVSTPAPATSAPTMSAFGAQTGPGTAGIGGTGGSASTTNVFGAASVFGAPSSGANGSTPAASTNIFGSGTGAFGQTNGGQK